MYVSVTLRNAITHFLLSTVENEIFCLGPAKNRACEPAERVQLRTVPS